VFGEKIIFNARIACAIAITAAPKVSGSVEVQGNNIIAADAEWIELVISVVAGKLAPVNVECVYPRRSAAKPQDFVGRKCSISQFFQGFAIPFVVKRERIFKRVQTNQTFIRA
jgi:hypothetical protein